MLAVYSTKPSDDDWQAVSDLLRGRIAIAGDCWEWIGCRMPHGHGQIKRAGMAHAMLVHRYVWSELFGPIPNCVCHHCDNPPCVRPTHLWLGTHKENMADMWAKGRGSKPPVRWDGIHCAKGHLLEGNCFVYATGARRCKKCSNEKSLAWYYANREQAKENRRRWMQRRREQGLPT